MEAQNHWEEFPEHRAKASRTLKGRWMSTYGLADNVSGSVEPLWGVQTVLRGKLGGVRRERHRKQGMLVTHRRGRAARVCGNTQLCKRCRLPADRWAVGRIHKPWSCRRLRLPWQRTSSLRAKNMCLGRRREGGLTLPGPCQVAWGYPGPHHPSLRWRSLWGIAPEFGATHLWGQVKQRLLIRKANLCFLYLFSSLTILVGGEGRQ